MKLLAKGLFVTVLSLIVGSSALAQQTPDWYNSGKLSSYPSGQYITGVAAGPSPEAANNNASKEVAEKIRVNIQSTTKLVQEEITTNDQTVFNDMFKSAVTSTVNESISGIEIVKQQKVGDSYYVFAALDKSKYLSSLRGRLENQETSIHTLIKEAKSFTKEGKIVAAIDNYGSAMQQIPKFYADKSLYDALSETSYSLTQDFAVSDIESEMRDLLSSIIIDVTEGNRQQAQAGQPLPEPIHIKLLYRFRGKEIALSGVTVKASYKDGATFDRIATDQNGEASLLAEAVPPEFGDRGEILLEPVLSNLPYGYRKYTRNAITSVRYEISDQLPLILSVDIRDKDGNPLDRVNDKVARSLGRLGHTVAGDAPLTLEGTVEVIESREVSTMGKTQTLVRAELSSQLKVAATGEVIGSFVSVEEGLSTSGEKAAMKSAYNRMKIDRRDFSEFVSRSSDKLNSIFGDRSKEYLEKGKQLMQQEEYQKAVEQLKMVVYGQEYVREARALMKDALSHLNPSMSGTGMAGYTIQERITFENFGQGDMLKDFGESVVAKGSGKEERYASVFKDGGKLELELPQKSSGIAIQIRAKVAPNNSVNQRYGIRGDGFQSLMTFNQGYYRKATFGSTTKDIDQVREFSWDSHGTNVILFTIEEGVIKCFLNGKLFGIDEVDSIPASKMLTLMMDQNDAIYDITVGTK